MIHTMTNRDGLWICDEPLCGRTMILTADPYTKSVLDEGDTRAVHTGGLGGVVVGGLEVRPQ